MIKIKNRNDIKNQTYNWRIVYQKVIGLKKDRLIEDKLPTLNKEDIKYHINFSSFLQKKNWDGFIDKFHQMFKE